MITVHTLASGSEGNCLVIDAEGTRILVDAGISTRRIKTTLEQLGIALAQVDAILITHGHSDHISGLQTLVKRHRIPIYASPATACQLAWRIAGIGPMLREVQRLTPFTVGAARITPFETSHDAAGASTTASTPRGGSVGILTDTGLITDEAADVLRRGVASHAREQPRRGMSALRALPLFAQAADSRPAGAPVERCRGGLRRADGASRHARDCPRAP